MALWWPRVTKAHRASLLRFSMSSCNDDIGSTSNLLTPAGSTAAEVHGAVMSCSAPARACKPCTRRDRGARDRHNTSRAIQSAATASWHRCNAVSHKLGRCSGRRELPYARAVAAFAVAPCTSGSSRGWPASASGRTYRRSHACTPCTSRLEGRYICCRSTGRARSTRGTCPPRLRWARSLLWAVSSWPPSSVSWSLSSVVGHCQLLKTLQRDNYVNNLNSHRFI